MAAHSGTGRGGSGDLMPQSTFELVDKTGVASPTYTDMDYIGDKMPHPQPDTQQPGKWNPKQWSKRVWAIVAIVIAIIIAVPVAVGVTQQRANRYPDYSRLDYSLSETYDTINFFDKFNYFTGYDPTHGFVHYVPEEQATQLNLTYSSSESAFLKVDTSVGPNDDPNASTGRFSVRVESKVQYEEGLFIFDVKHTPYGCGTWPALWLVDSSNWPDNGEIDVMESTNQATSGTQMTLHTTSSCSMSVKRLMRGSSEQDDCDNEIDDNAGCGVRGPSASTGEAFNKAGGGIMALEWRDAGIRVWQFGRSSIPTDITSKNPDPSSWGQALADFPATECDMTSHFRNQSIVANVDLCGDLTEAVYSDAGCPSNCTDYVANNPTAFVNAYWEFGAFEVYKAK